MRICLGIDPGLARVGYGAVMKLGLGFYPLSYGCISTTPAMTFTERLLKIYTDLQEKITVISPDFLSVERLFFGKNATTAEYVYQARGVIMLLVAQNHLPVVELTPNNIKRNLTGSGKSNKREIQMAIRDILSLEEIPRPDDTADALAAALAGLSLCEGG
ncbi:MAG: crossover junction endodeoxyribonuclease RuvC [Synergistaceae bacterium]|nr:crossover junction endodeoxyribonuclease RuvC [Synergistaceae bacterium]MBR0279898.1 crossover junction endodeoxyribonuclease RuvC [Synergistaceae bacterium]